MVNEKFIGLSLAVLASCAIGSSYVITKTGLNQATKYSGFDGDGFEYLRSPIWWCGTIVLVSGELLNTAAYAFAPATLVTPMGALSVLVGTVMAAQFLNEEVRILGRLGCATCLLGSILLIMHAPPDKDIQTIDEVLVLAIQPLFLFYCSAVTVFSLYIIYKVAPIHGKTNPLVYISVCSTIGSISVMSVKAFGVAVKLTLSGVNQFTRPSTYVFMFVLVVTTFTQLNYLNKAMSEFPTTLVNAMYYVGFTTCTITASVILFRGLNTSDAIAIISMVCGFLLNFAGIALLTLSKTSDDDYVLAPRDNNSSNINRNTGNPRQLRSVADMVLTPLRASLKSSGYQRLPTDGAVGGSGRSGAQVVNVWQREDGRNRRASGSITSLRLDDS